MNNKCLASVLLAFFLIGALAGCNLLDRGSSSEPSSSSEPEIPEFPVTVRDTRIPEKPLRVISLSPAATEMLCDMGYGDRLVGISDYCDQPESITGLPACGTPHRPGLEQIEKLRPDLILSSANLTESDLIAVQQMDADVLTLARADDFEGIFANYRDLAVAMDGETTGGEYGEEFTEKIQKRLDSLESRLSAYVTDENRVSAVYVRMLDFNLATGDTFENTVFRLIHVDNLAEGHTGWSFPAEDWAEAAPDILFCDNSITMTMFEQNQYYRNKQAVLHDIWLPVDGSAFERQSLRMLDIIEAMAYYAYEDAFTDSVPSSGEDEGSDLDTDLSGESSEPGEPEEG